MSNSPAEQKVLDRLLALVLLPTFTEREREIASLVARACAQLESDKTWLRAQRDVAEEKLVAEARGRQQAERDEGVTVWPPPDDPMEPYLKEGETPAECVARNRADVQTALGLLAKEKQQVAALTQALKDIVAHDGERWDAAYEWPDTPKPTPQEIAQAALRGLTGAPK
jgi:hypothetical protein